MIYVGSAGWNIPRAHKQRFPENGTGLQRYAARLTAAEINSSFYRPHARTTYERWSTSVPAGFRFSVKIPKIITHERGLTRAREPLARFLDEVAGLGARLGPLLLQLPPSHAFDARRVGRFLDLLRSAHEGPVVCEPRHATWTSDAASRLLLKFRVARGPAARGGAGGAGRLARRRVLPLARVSPSVSPYSAEQLPGLAVKLTQADGERAPRVSHANGAGPGSPRVSVQGSPRGEAPRLEEAWCIFDNTGSGSAAGNALDLRALLA